MPRVTRNEEKSRYEIYADDEVAGFAVYSVNGDILTAPSTFVFDEHRGQGFAGQLVEKLLDDAREANLSVLPACSYVASFIKSNEEYLDLVPAERRDEFGL